MCGSRTAVELTARPSRKVEATFPDGAPAGRLPRLRVCAWSTFRRGLRPAPSFRVLEGGRMGERGGASGSGYGAGGGRAARWRGRHQAADGALPDLQRRRRHVARALRLLPAGPPTAACAGHAGRGGPRLDLSVAFVQSGSISLLPHSPVQPSARRVPRSRTWRRSASWGPRRITARWCAGCAGCAAPLPAARCGGRSRLTGAVRRGRPARRARSS